MGRELAGLDPIVLGHGTVDTEQDRLVFRWKGCHPQATFGAANRYVGSIRDFGHPTSVLGRT